MRKIEVIAVGPDEGPFEVRLYLGIAGAAVRLEVRLTVDEARDLAGSLLDEAAYASNRAALVAQLAAQPALMEPVERAVSEWIGVVDGVLRPVGGTWDRGAEPCGEQDTSDN